MLKNFRNNALGLAKFSQLTENPAVDLNLQLYKQLQLVMEKDSTQQDPFGYCEAYKSFKGLLQEAPSYEHHKKKVNQLFTSCMQAL